MRDVYSFLAAGMLLAASSYGAQVALTPANVIGGSGSYGGTFNSGQFNATQVLDTQTGPVSEPSQSGYWLNPDGGPADGYIVIDLGAPVQISQLDLFNTHNSQFQDRGTGNFTITGANAVTDLGGGNFDITGPSTVILSNTLAGQPAVDPITDQSFAVTDPGSYRYIRFDATSVATGGGNCCGANNYGLNEIRVFTAVPEPVSLSMLGLAGTAMLVRRRRA